MTFPESEAGQTPNFDIVERVPLTEDAAVSCAGKAAIAINKKRLLRKRFNPEEVAEVESVFAKAIFENSRIPCILLWGVGKKLTAGCWEKDALDQLDRLNKALKTEWLPGLLFHFVFADVHARVNRVPEGTILSYYESMVQLLNSSKFLETRMICLSELWRSMHKRESDIEGMVKKISFRQYDPSFEPVLKNAKRNYHGDNAVDGALKYMATRFIDSDVISREYRHCVYLTYNNPKTTSFLHPDLPVLYAWSIRKGKNRAPWFMPNEECK